MEDSDIDARRLAITVGVFQRDEPSRVPRAVIGMGDQNQVTFEERQIVVDYDEAGAYTHWTTYTVTDE